MNIKAYITLVSLLLFSSAISQPSNYSWTAEFDDNYNNTRLFIDGATGSNIRSLTIIATSATDEYVIEWNSFSDKWQNGNSPLNEQFQIEHGASGSPNGVINGGVVTNKYYTFQIEGLDYSNRNAVIMETDNLPIGFDATNPVVQSNTNVFPNQDVVLNVNLSGNKSPQEKAFVRFSHDGFTTSEIVEVNFTNPNSSTGIATIPANYNTAGRNVSFYVYTTTITATNASNHNLITLNQANNSGANYSYTVNSSWTTFQNGSFSDDMTWTANQVPPANQDVSILHDVDLDIDYTANSVIIDSGGSLTNTTQTLSILNNGNITNANALETSISGTVIFEGVGFVFGELEFNDVEINGSIDFGDPSISNQSTINGSLTLNSGSFVNGNSPIYGMSSTLIYQSNGFYNRSSEWSNPNSTQGNPANVIVQNNTTLNLGAENRSNDAVLTGDITVDAVSTLELNNNTQEMIGSLVVGGSFENNGTVNLSDITGSDLKIDGNFTNTGTFDFNNRALFFEGNNAQQLNVTSPDAQFEIPFLVIDKSGGEVVLNKNITVFGDGVALEMINNSILNLNGTNLVIGETGSSTTVSFSSNSFLRSSSGLNSNLTLKGTQNFYDIPFEPTANFLANIYLEKENNSSVGLANEVMLKEGITLKNGVLNSNGNLVFVSDADNTAIVRPEVDGTFNGTINGDVLVQRHFPLSKRSFRYISSSVNTNSSSKPTIHENWQEGATDASDLSNPYDDPNFNPEAEDRFGTHITGAPGQVGDVDESTGFDMTETGNNSLFTWDEVNQTWDEVTSTNQTSDILEVGDAFALMVRGDRSATLESNTAIGDNPATLRTTGALDLSNFTYNFDAPYDAMDPNEFVLVGNPYQAQVDMIDVLADGGTTGISPNYLWVWDPTLTDKGAYAVVDVSDPDNPEDIDGLPSSSQANQYLQPFQAVFVQVDAGPSQTVQFQRDDIDNSVPQTTVFSTANASKIEIEIHNSQTSLLLDAARLQFGANYNNAKTFEDAAKFWNYDEYLAIVNNNSYLSIDKRNLPQTNDTIPLYLGNYQNSQYTLNLESSLDSGIDAQLYDEYLDQTLVLASGLNNYNFTIDTAIPESIDNQRFKLVFNPQTLGVEENSILDNIKVFPNPVKDNFINLRIPELLLEQKAKVELFDGSGRLLLQKDIKHLNRQETLDLSRFSSGFYILKIQANGTEQSFKLTKI